MEIDKFLNVKEISFSRIPVVLPRNILYFIIVRYFMYLLFVNKITKYISKDNFVKLCYIFSFDFSRQHTIYKYCNVIIEKLCYPLFHCDRYTFILSFKK